MDSTSTPVSTFEFYVTKNTYELEYLIKQKENEKQVVKVITYPMYQSLDDININDNDVDVFAINAQYFSNVREFLLKCEIFGKSVIITVDDSAENFKEIINAIPLADSFVKENRKFLKKNLPKIALFMGPMRAGKSYEIIRLIHQCEILGLQITKIIPSLDSRSDGEIKSRTGSSSMALKITDLSEVSFETFTATNVFVLDEAQFLKGLKEFVIKCKNNNKTVFISGLDGDFKRNPIGEVLDCIPYCDEVVKLTALCMKELDGTPAIFSYLVNKTNVDGQVLVGDSEFLSLSRKAFLEMEN
jgi:thymidine kinase